MIGCLGLAWLFSLGTGHGQEVQPSEYKIKAAFLFNFAKFIEWPPESFAATNSPMIIGILGDNPFGGDLEEIVRNKSINNRTFVIKEMHSLSEAAHCHLLFISNSEKKRFAEVFEGVRGASVLTVGETDGFTDAGGMINFVREGKKLRFQINHEAATKVKLKISSKLLALALTTGR